MNVLPFQNHISIHLPSHSIQPASAGLSPVFFQAVVVAIESCRAYLSPSPSSASLSLLPPDLGAVNWAERSRVDHSLHTSCLPPSQHQRSSEQDLDHPEDSRGGPSRTKRIYPDRQQSRDPCSFSLDSASSSWLISRGLCIVAAARVSLLLLLIHPTSTSWFLKQEVSFLFLWFGPKRNE